jgi:outer membrane immunogenic protein
MRVSVVALIAAISLSAASANLAAAADLPAQVPAYRGPALVPVPAFSWTGFYLGVHVGGAYGTDKVTEVTGSADFPAGFIHTTNNPVGPLVGGYAGVNYQINQLVIGLDGDYSALFLEGKSTSVGPTGSRADFTEKIRWLATGTGRVGVSFGSWMLYGKGGWAWAGFKSDAAIFNAAGVNTSTETSSDKRSAPPLSTPPTRRSEPASSRS